MFHQHLALGRELCWCLLSVAGSAITPWLGLTHCNISIKQFYQADSGSQKLPFSVKVKHVAKIAATRCCLEDCYSHLIFYLILCFTGRAVPCFFLPQPQWVCHLLPISVCICGKGSGAGHGQQSWALTALYDDESPCREYLQDLVLFLALKESDSVNRHLHSDWKVERYPNFLILLCVWCRSQVKSFLWPAILGLYLFQSSLSFDN